MLRVKSKHRLMCGDSTDKADVDKLMDGSKADMVLTDPPYSGHLGGGGFKASPKIAAGKDKLMASLEGLYDFNPTDTFPIIDEFKNEKISIFLFCNKILVPDYLNYALREKRLFDILTWHKPSCIPANNGTYFPDTEYLIKIKDKGATFNVGLGEKASYNKYWIIDSKSEGRDINHPTVKPIKILSDCIYISSLKDDLVLDLFLGSGSTLIASEKTNRRCYGMELEPHYCSVAIKRWENFTGLTATRDGQNEAAIQ